MTRLMSFCTSATVAAKNAVMAPTIVTTVSAVCESSKSGDSRATMKTPAVTMVAAWISAETGVGPSIASGSQVCKGTCADLPMAPMKSSRQTTVIGATTAFFAATVGLVQNDIKRVIAYSTCSQLGYMFVALGVGAYGVAIFHLFTHAFFKALLFLCSGSVIHAVSDEQDMRKMGGLRKLIPYTYWTMIIGTLSLTGVGIPLTIVGTAGFISKDAIVEAAFSGQNAAATFAFVLLTVAAAFTAFYSWRLIFMTFHGKPRASHDVMHHVHESPPVMLIPLFVLAAGALFAGAVFEVPFIGEGYHEFWRTALFAASGNDIMETFEHSPLLVKLAPFVAMLVGTWVAWIFYVRSPKAPHELAEQHRGLYAFLYNKWYFDEVYDFLFVRPAKRLGTFLWKRGDGTVIDGFGPDGVSAWVIDVTNRVVKLQTGYLYHYAFVMLIGIVALITWMMLGSYS